jgi:agarase
MLDWGFNTIGPWSSPSIAAEMPHSIVILDVAAGNAPRHPEALVTDYWDPAFAAHCARMARERATPHVEDPRLLGYFLDNEIVWGADHFRTDESLVQLYAGFPPEAPGRVEMLGLLRETAGTLDAFNAAWATALDDWAQLDSLTGAQLQPATDAARAATEAFMLRAFERYATTAIAELRAVDPNHLILGCRFHNYPGDALARAAARHFDVISLAFYEARPPVAEIDAVWPEINKPFLIEEWTFKSDDSGIRNTLAGIYAPRVRTQAERGLAYHDYVEAFMRRPYGIGYHWYKWMDNPVLGPDQPLTGDNCGLLTADDAPYAPFVEFVREVNRRVERWHAEGGSPTPHWKP